MLDRGTMVAGYRIDGVLGEGGMGVVYRATQLSLNRTVALKILAGELSDDSGFRERFRREGQLQAIIDHPHIVTVYEAGQTEHGLFLAMRLVRGPNLKDAIVAGELDPRRAVNLLGQVAEALDSAHDVGLIHRDVKPQNILIGAREHAYLADFGLMKAPDTDSLTQTGQFVGTIDYVSPEQARGEGATGQSDVYALTGVLYECLTGDIPFDRPSEAAILYAHMVEPPPHPSDRRRDLPLDLDAVIERGMAKDADDRYANAGELIRDAARALGVAPPAPPSPAKGAAAPTVPATTVDPDGPGGSPDVTRAAAVPAAGDVTAPGHVPQPAPGTREAPAPPAGQTAPAAPAGRSRTATPVPAPAGPAAPPAPPARAPGLPVPLLVLAAVLGVVAIAAGLVAGRSGGGDGAAELSNSASAGPIALSFPAGWRRASNDPGVPGLRLSDPIVLQAPGAGAGAGQLVAGSTDAEGPTLLPAAFLRELDAAPARDDAVRLGDVQAYRYRGLRPKGLSGPVTLYAVPTTSGVVTLGCVGRGAAAGFAADCERVAGSLQVSGARPYALGPSQAVARLLTRTTSRLDRERATGVKRMSAAKTPSAQAQAAAGLESAYKAASRSLSGAQVSPADAQAVGGLAGALGGIANGYGRAAAAARRDDDAAFAAAGRSIRSAGAASARAVKQLGQLGYSVSG